MSDPHAGGGQATGSPERVSVERPRLRRVGRSLVVPGLIAIGVFIGLALLADIGELRQALGQLDAAVLVPLFGLSLLNYALRFLRWELYLRSLELRLAPAASLATFLVGFTLSITPGKAGELGKAWLVRELGGGPARRGVAAVLGERVLDLLAMVLLVAIGSVAYAGGRVYAAVGIVVFAALIAVLCSSAAMHRLLGWGSRLPGVGGRLHLVEEVWDRLRTLLRFDRLALGLVLSVLAWGAEGVGCYLVLGVYSSEVSGLAAVFTYSFSTLLGALSMLPGGLLAAEGTLAAMLDAQGLSLAEASAATMVIRVATLWFAVLLGVAAVPYLVGALRRRRSLE